MSKVFKNNQHLSFEEMLVYLQSRLGMKEVEIGCFLCNYEDGTVCKEKVCKNYFNCTQMKRELNRLDNASTAIEIEKLLQPVYLYREELKRSKKKEKVLVVEKPEIVVHGTKEKPYFEIKYKEVGNDDYNIGYSSYDLNNCFQWLEEEFEVASEVVEIGGKE